MPLMKAANAHTTNFAGPMTINPLNHLSLLAALPTVLPEVSNTLTSAQVQSSSTVTLGQCNSSSGAGTYSLSNPVLWESKDIDGISSSMRLDFSAQSLAGRFDKIGAALLDRFKTEGSSFSQSILQLAPGIVQGPNASASIEMLRSQLHTQADNQITLDVLTKSGVKVELALGSQHDGLAVQVKVSNGTLSDSDRSALASLSDAFQRAIDGLTSVPPQLDLSGLTQFDASVVSSVELHASINTDNLGPQTLDFHADSHTRSLVFNGPSGKVQVNVDMSKTAIQGSAAQQAKTIDTYLQQFDDAQKRGHGDASLMAMFKDAFAEVNSDYGAKPASWRASETATSAPLADHGDTALSGLADFSASIDQTSESPNPMRPDERDTFAYQASQSTSVASGYQQSRSIKQHQQTHLNASYHQALSSDTPLLLTASAKSQNYLYYAINDNASSTTELKYNDSGLLTKATQDESTSRDVRIQKYLLGRMIEDTATPLFSSQSRDLLKLLRSA